MDKVNNIETPHLKVLNQYIKDLSYENFQKSNVNENDTSVDIKVINKPHDDDWLVMAAWVLLTLWMFAHDRSRIARATPWVAVLTPLILVTAMAFGFRQNVPNRGGLLFSKIEYHYYVTLRPLWRN